MHICFWDIDGTLLRTGGAGQSAFATTLADEFGIRQIDSNVGFSGRSDKAIAMDLFRSHGIDASEDNWQRFCAGYLGRLEQALHDHRGGVLPGVIELLEALRERGDVAIGLLTGNMREGARRKLGYYGLWDWFPFGGFGDEHMDRCDIAAAAITDADLHLSGRNGLQNSTGRLANRQVIVIGDTPHDVRCGRSIGALCVAVPTGTCEAAVLRDSEPDVFVETLEDSRPILALLR